MSARLSALVRQDSSWDEGELPIVFREMNYQSCGVGVEGIRQMPGAEGGAVAFKKRGEMGEGHRVMFWKPG